MRCSRCGAENAPGSNVCAACGTPFAQATPVAPVAPVAPMFVNPAIPGSGLGVASMVLGILSLIFCWAPYFGAILALIGCVLGAVSMVTAKKAGMRANGMSIAGLVCSIISLAVAAIFTIAAIVACIEAQEAIEAAATLYRYY